MFDLYMRIVARQTIKALRGGRRTSPRRGRGTGPGTCLAEVETLETRRLLSVSILNGNGAGYVGNGGGGPPDVTGAAGPSSYLEISNSTVTLFSPKPGGAILAQRGINDFFFNANSGNLSLITPTSRGTADSTGGYDNLMGDGRFIIGDIDIDTTANVSQYIFAVSKSNNPTTFTPTDWNFYTVNTTQTSGGNTRWTDYPGNLGFNEDAIVETFNMAKGNSLTGDAELIAIDATDLLNGASQASLHTYQSFVTGTNSYRATTMHDAAAGDPMWLVRNPQDGTHVDVTRMDNVLSNAPTLTLTSLALPASKNFAATLLNDPLNPDGSAIPDGAVEDGEGEGGDDGGDGDVQNPDSTPANDIDDRILKAGEWGNTLVAAQKVAVGSASVVSATVKVNSGVPARGSGYAVGDVLTVNGGTFSTAAQLTVASVNGSGGVTSVTVANAGNYTSFAGVTGAVSGGGGSGAQFSFNLRGELDVQWYAIDVSGTPAFQQVGGVANVGRIGFGANTYCVDPAIDINSKGEIGFGFMESDTTGGAITGATGGFISTFVTARKPTDAAGTMQPLVLVSAGTGSANINARIGDFSGMNVDPSNGTFWHVNEFGGGAVPTVIANFTPEDRPVVTAPPDQTAVEGASKAFTLGSFADTDGSPWTVTVAWGDGLTDTFTTSSMGSLGMRSHTYAEEGAKVVTVTVTDSTTLSDSKTFNVSVKDPSVLGTGGFVLHPVEGADSGAQVVATFTDPGGPEVVGDYAAVIDWGDGTATTAGVISVDGSGTFSVKGNHTYAEESAGDHAGSNPYAITVTLKHESSDDVVVGSTADVSDPAVIATGGFTFTAIEGQPSATQTVATFIDPGGAEGLADYKASIDWGDGTATTAGVISFAGGVFTVQGSHTYATGLGTPGDLGNTLCDATAPSYHKPITVKIEHESAPVATAVSDAKISLPENSAHVAGDGSLIVVGTQGDDQILFEPNGNVPRSVKVQIGSTTFGPFTVGAAGRIVVAAIAGNDNIQVAGGIGVDTALYAGPGDDRIKGGGGRNIEVGCDGNDQLNAGRLGDLLIGGEGADYIVGGNGDDLLVAGTIVDATNVEDVRYFDLVGILNAGRVNLPFRAMDDNAVDRLTGAAGIDAAYYNILGAGAKDVFTDKAEFAFDEV